MAKYPIKLILDYINGEELNGYDIDVLENDPLFMKEVINVSNDKKTYNLCSDSVKKNYQFVKFLIQKFNKDSKFISDIAQQYLDSSTDELTNLEILILMCNILSPECNEYIRFKTLLFVMQKREEIDIEATKIDAQKNDPSLLNDIGETGFLIVYDDFNTSQIITDYFAKQFLERLLDPEKHTFEDFLHTRFNSLEELNNTPIKTYLIEYISYYDSMLASYISTHIQLLEETLSKIELIKRRWNTYPARLESLKYHRLFDYIQKYFEAIDYQCSYSEDEMLYLISEELGITSTTIKYDPSMSVDSEEFEETLEEVKQIDLTTMPFKDLSHYNNIRNIVIRFLSANSLKELEDIEIDFDEFTAPTSPNVLDISKFVKRPPHRSLYN